MKRLILLIVMAAMLAGCGAELPHLPPDAPDVAAAMTDAPLISMAGEPEPPPETTAPPPPPELPPPVIPDEVHTNIDAETAIPVFIKLRDTAASVGASVYFTDVEREYYFGIDEETWYHTASTIKAVYCHYLLSSGVDLEAEVTFTNANRTSVTGKLSANDVGKSFTVGELMELALRYSDNQAHRLLYETFGIEGYNRYVSGLGAGGLQMSEEWEWSRVSAKKLSRAMLDIYRYGKTDDFVIEHLKNASYNGQIPAGTAYETAHKYGANGGGDGYHDTAIVYAPGRAYILTILTGIDPAKTADEDAIFREIAGLCDELHAILFADL
ncbi:MAG: serine hydrolase [Ruminococcaceae bacterium]|nr:serine hydrolase [Oscillospiraceae bacterium]